jgi:hypothetical protein
METLETVVKRRLENAEANARQFADIGASDSAEFWNSVAGILFAILDEASAS